MSCSDQRAGKIAIKQTNNCYPHGTYIVLEKGDKQVNIYNVLDGDKYYK